MTRIRSLLAIVALLVACGPREDLPTVTVTVGPFVHTVTAEGILEAAKVTPLTVPQAAVGNVRLAWLAADGTLVQAGDVVARFDAVAIRERLFDGENELARVERRGDKVKHEAAGRDAEIATKIQVSELELDMSERFHLDDANVFSRHEIIESEIDGQLARERREHAVGSLETQRVLAATDVELLEIDRRKAGLRVDQARDALRALEIVAPHDGLLTLRRDWSGEPVRVGSELWQGQQIAQIPDLGNMRAQVFVLEADAGGLTEGKAAEVVVEARPGLIIPARIERVDSVAKPRFRGSPVQYFGVTLVFEAPPAETLKPGQRVRATLRLAEREEAMVLPRQAVFERDGKPEVFVREGSGFASRPVVVGLATPGLVELVEGVEAGDIVALRRPTGITDHADATPVAETAAADDSEAGST